MTLFRCRMPGSCLSLIGVALLVLCLAAPLRAAPDEPEGWAYSLANDLMSPFCPGRTLAECPSPQADELRLWIIVQEASGRSQDEVVEELYGKFGDVIRSAPEARGIGITAYALPVVGFVVGGILVAVVLRRVTSKTAAVGESETAAAAPPLDPEFERLIDEERGG